MKLLKTIIKLLEQIINRLDIIEEHIKNTKEVDNKQSLTSPAKAYIPTKDGYMAHTDGEDINKAKYIKRISPIDKGLK